MAVTAQTRDAIIGLSVAMLGKAPGTELLNEWYGVYNASVGKGMSPEDALLELANHIAASDAFTSMYPFFITNAEFARDFLTAALGEAPSAEVLALATGLLNGGMGRGEMGLLAVQQLLEIRMQGESHPAYGDFGALAMMFANKVEVATYYTVTKRWEGDSASVLGGVTGDGDSVTAAKEAIDMMQRPGKSFELTTGVDRLDGTLGDDTFVATEKTLTGVDRLDGGEGMDTLELSSSGSDDDVSVSSGASVMHVETLTVDSGGDFSADLSGWEGLTDVVLSDVAGDVELDAGGADVSSKSLEGDTVEIMNAAMVNLEDVNARAQVNIFDTDTTTSVMVEGGKGVEVGKSTAHSETVKSVTLDGVRDGMGDDGKRYGANTAAKEAADGKAAVAAVNNKDSVPVHIYSKAIESVDLRNTNTTLLVENAARDMTELTAMVDRFGNTANGHGKLCLKGIEDLMIEVKGDSNIRLASDQIKTVAVSGAGDLTLDVTKFAPAVAEKAADVKPSETLESIDASEASGAVKIAALNKSVMSYMGSMGKDDVSVTAFNAKGLTANLGAGDDMFTVANVKAGKSRIDGGAGMDTLVLKEKTGANLKGAGDAYTGFETITLDAGGGSGTYDLKGLDIDKLMISKGAAGKITFKDVASGTELKVSSKAPDSATGKRSAATDVEASYMLADGDDDELMLHLHTDGGAKDEKGELGVKNQGILNLTLTVDKEVEKVTVRSTATVRAEDKTVKVGDYVNRLTITNSTDTNRVEELVVTGDAALYINRNAKIRDGNYGSLTEIDASENTGGFFIHASGTAAAGSPAITILGSPADDLLWGVDGGKADTLVGNAGNDVIVGFNGEDKITGGAGADRLFPYAADILVFTGGVGVGELGAVSHANRTDEPDAHKDTFIYKAASDSQVDLEKMTGFDMIFTFSSSGDNKDSIQLSPVLDLRGSVKPADDSVKGSNLKTVVGDGKDVFVTEATGTAFARANSVAIVKTTEDKTKINKGHPVFFSIDDDVDWITGNNIQLTWVLVDVDGDGDFSAGTDMAIALAGHMDLDATVFS